MKFSLARSLAMSIASTVALVHSNIDAVKAAASESYDGPSEQSPVALAAATLDTNFNALHNLLGKADKGAYELFAKQTEGLGFDLSQILDRSHTAPQTLSGGTPKDDPVVQPESQDADDVVIEEPGEINDEAVLNSSVDLSDLDNDD